MPSVTITAAFVRNVRCSDGVAKESYFDVGMIGFMLEVRSSGRKTFYQRYVDRRGRQRQIKIGSALIITTEQAKQKAKAVCAEAILGSDPQQRRQQIRAVPTLAKLVHDRYLPFIKQYKRSWRTDEALLRIHILPDMGTMHLDEVTEELISDLVRRMRIKGYSPATTNRIIVLLRYIFNLARRWNVFDRAYANPTLGITLAHEEHRERFLTPEETQRLLFSLSEFHDQLAADAILLLLLTGARRCEIIQAKWENVDLRQRTLLVPRSKSGKPRRIILNDHAVSLFRSIKRTRANPFVFPLPSTGRPPTTLFRQWHRIRCKAGLPDLRLHDLRHSFASFLVNKGVSLYVVQGLLGHSQIRTTQRYAHLNQQTLQDAVEVVGQYLPRTENGHSFEEIGGENVLKSEQDSELVTAWSRQSAEHTK